ncbi:MAG: TonB family protein [Candidatus Thiodiazotropha sp. (ex Dulcina madagascariensis)]|nr:TonB family protein [Candidatus Thiodiazotropha sp. (ex Epidulcina cf. delphinae)]MCU7935825.1 TonB family protein [Candidatus Thiodiazotropha sp. (ex Dulcina madagascariensis)]
MTLSSTGRRLLALSISILLHLLTVTAWSDKLIPRAALEQEQTSPLFVQLNFPQPVPEIVPDIIQPVKPVIKQVAKPKPKPKPKPKKKQINSTPKPVVMEKAPQIEPAEEAVVKRQPPTRAQPQANLRERYLAKLLARIEEKKYYPSIARRRNIEGKIRVSFKLECDGKVTQLAITGQHSLLRKAAGKAVNAAQPLPEIPPQIECPLPISYAMAYTLDN